MSWRCATWQTRVASLRAVGSASGWYRGYPLGALIEICSNCEAGGCVGRVVPVPTTLTNQAHAVRAAYGLQRPGQSSAGAVCRRLTLFITNALTIETCRSFAARIAHFICPRRIATCSLRCSHRKALRSPGAHLSPPRRALPPPLTPNSPARLMAATPRCRRRGSSSRVTRSASPARRSWPTPASRQRVRRRLKIRSTLPRGGSTSRVTPT